ncbi:Hypothetical predicted protein [Paramuricea clavata]|uniref:Uncharacterized protein n=1 Tax=Paramuricea clavata TaxID=317549 RepID=A0A6S7GQE9_PARCT|nr:Hypothetical predicted protein [Paramuricea clavata]
MLPMNLKDFAVEKNPSILANSTPHNVINITDACIASELKNRAPTMERILRAAVSGKVKHTVEEEYNEKDKKNVRALSMATSILLRCRNPALSALSYRLSLLLWHGGAEKQSINKEELVPTSLVGPPIITTESVSDSQIANPSFQTESLHKKYGIDENILKEKLNKAKGAVEGRINEAIIDEVMDKLRNLCNSHASYEENLKYTQMKIELSHAPGYQLTGDNVDLYVKVKHMSSTNQNSSIHWFNINAVFNRMNNNQLNNNTNHVRS